MTRRTFYRCIISLLLTVVLTWVISKLKMTQYLFPIPQAAEDAMASLLFLMLGMAMWIWLWRGIRKINKGQHVFSSNIEIAVIGGVILCLLVYLMNAVGMTDYLRAITSANSPRISYSKYMGNVTPMSTNQQVLLIVLFICMVCVLLRLLSVLIHSFLKPKHAHQEKHVVPAPPTVSPMKEKAPDPVPSEAYFIAKDLGRYQEKAALGDAHAMSMLGSLYALGRGVEKDFSKAMEWYQKAAQLGELNSLHLIGYMYEYGLGVPQNMENAEFYYQKARDAGFKD